jgi:hypothetical protein
LPADWFDRASAGLAACARPVFAMRILDAYLAAAVGITGVEARQRVGGATLQTKLLRALRTRIEDWVEKPADLQPRPQSPSGKFFSYCRAS